jgi:L-amino acid N-acyltransferase YncA
VCVCVQEFAERMRVCSERFPWLLAKHPTLGIVGYAYATSYKARAAYRWTVETSVYVSRDCHRMHVGSKLYKCLFSILTELNIRSIFVCIGVPNENSFAFHRRMGFEDAGLFRRAGFKRGRWVDSAWLQKFLPEQDDPHPSATEPFEEDLDRVLPEPLPVTSLSAEQLEGLLRLEQPDNKATCS